MAHRAPIRRLFTRVFFEFLLMLTVNQLGLAVGTVIGLALSALLFFTVPAYHNYLVWSWSHYWFLAPFGVAGFIIGYLRR